MRRLRLLHLSDLHVGKEGQGSRWRMRRVLGSAWAANLRTLAQDGPIDLVCFTGDMAQSGQSSQYAEAGQFVDELLTILQVPRERFFCVPGNHDIDRTAHCDAWKAMREAARQVDADRFGRYLAKDGRAPYGCQAEWADQVLARQAAYHD